MLLINDLDIDVNIINLGENFNLDWILQFYFAQYFSSSCKFLLSLDMRNLNYCLIEEGPLTCARVCANFLGKRVDK